MKLHELKLLEQYAQAKKDGKEKWEQKKMNKQIDFIVIDKNTGKQADISEIALSEDWAKDLMYCDMEGFAINENGQLVLLDECGNFAYCPYDRFTIQFENSVVLTKEEFNQIHANFFVSGIEHGRNETAREILVKLKEKCKEFENKYSHLCKSKKEALMETCRYEGVLAVKRELNELAKQYGVEIKG